MLLVALMFGGYSIAIFGGTRKFPLWIFVSVIMMGLVGAWIRAIVDHRSIQKRLLNQPESMSRDELLKLAAFWPTHGLALMYFVAAMLLFCLATALKYYEAVR
jgi:hypothetical protein